MIYVASSWRCKYQPRVVQLLREQGHDVYDFRAPRPGDHGFSWLEVDPEYEKWTPTQFRTALLHPIATRGFCLDMEALRACNSCLCVLPCGRSAHLEVGWASGVGKRTAIYMPEPSEPELMYSMLGDVLLTEEEICKWAHDGADLVWDAGTGFYTHRLGS